MGNIALFIHICRRRTFLLLQAAYHLRLAELSLPPAVDAILLRLVLSFLSYKQCKKAKRPEEKVTLTTPHGAFHPTQKRIRRKMLAVSLADSLNLSSCPGSHNCDVVTAYANLQATLESHFGKLNQLNPPSSSGELYAGGKLTESTTEAIETAKADLHTALEESVVFSKNICQTSVNHLMSIR